MEPFILLSPGAALGVIAFLLSLLPAGVFVWLWYLRRRDRALPASIVALAFLTGIGLVVPAFWLEDMASKAWLAISPSTAHYFAGTPNTFSFIDILLPAIGTFAIVALIEEGLRYAVLRSWITYSRKTIDQVFDGLIIGVAVGVGFATLENTLYFLSLFRDGSYETLVFVFFLRFLISTLAHISFSGMMGVLLARNQFEFLSGRRYGAWAFFIPWLLHGLFDWMLAVQLGAYSVLILLPALLTLMFWSGLPEMFVIHRKNGKLLPTGEVADTPEMRNMMKLLETTHTPWNKYAPWLNRASAQRRITNAISYDDDKK